MLHPRTNLSTRSHSTQTPPIGEPPVEDSINEEEAPHHGTHQAKPRTMSLKRKSQEHLLPQRKVQDQIRGATRFAALGRKVVTALTFKHVLQRAEAATQAQLDPEPEKLPPELPVKPRFCATLSREAQYAMLKGYEDLLLNYLQEYYPHKIRYLPRCNSPAAKSEALVESDSESDAESENTNPAYSMRADTVAKTDQVDSINEQKRKLKHAKTKQLVLTCRFQSAMDMLDTIRNLNGHLVTSPRLKERAINPVEGFGSWKVTWSKEFKFKPTE